MVCNLILHAERQVDMLAATERLFEKRKTPQ